MANYTVSGNRSKGYSITKDNSSNASRVNIITQAHAQKIAKSFSKLVKGL